MFEWQRKREEEEDTLETFWKRSKEGHESSKSHETVEKVKS